jgi:hypothetical protein
MLAMVTVFVFAVATFAVCLSNVYSGYQMDPFCALDNTSKVC